MKGETWRIEIVSPPGAVVAFEAVLEPFCEVISCFVNESDDNWHIEGYGPAKPNASALASALSTTAGDLGLNAPVVQIDRMPDRDWVGESLRLFPPVSIGRYFIHGDHYRNPVPAGKIALRLNTGAAFGSGEHASTEGCLAALDDLARSRRFALPLDMGCGSGILSLAMAGTWRVSVLGADNDPRAVQVARDNVRRNGLASLVSIVKSDGYASKRITASKGFDLIVSNILANPLCRMAGDLARILSPGGVAVLAGFHVRDGNRVLRAHRSQGLILKKRYDINGWRTLVLEKPDRADRPAGAHPWTSECLRFLRAKGART